ncbi:EamA family transporter [Rosenbergiella australiborealis]|uniref:EamA family transporter n=1 Tax=Rosenbergiella australiborealis TaxID=1544696 RepID=A0ABS5T4W9_9GAMM|nr:EamA family transporter [Rosenbergiella australiborealis]MBT0727376.1 EamA family transporter [Rosenbergiella australiborealis]
MSIKDVALALLVILIWGLNFVVIKVGLHNFSPFLLAGLRFTFVAFPACLIVSRPKVPLRLLAAYGLSISFLQFALLFLALNLGMPAGLASLLLQSQAFFTLLFGALCLGDKVKTHHIIGLIIAIVGMVWLAKSSIHPAQATGMSLFTLLLTLGAALSWGVGNIINKIILRHYPVEPLKLVVWSAFIPILPFFICATLTEGEERLWHSLQNISWSNVLTLFYLAILCTVVGYAIWGGLLGKYPTATVAPLTLLVPIVGMISAAFFLGESLSSQQIFSVILIIFGLIINSFAPHILHILRRNRSPHIDAGKN